MNKVLPNGGGVNRFATGGFPRGGETGAVLEAHLVTCSPEKERTLRQGKWHMAWPLWHAAAPGPPTAAAHTLPITLVMGTCEARTTAYRDIGM